MVSFHASAEICCLGSALVLLATAGGAPVTGPVPSYHESLEFTTVQLLATELDVTTTAVPEEHILLSNDTAYESENATLALTDNDDDPQDMAKSLKDSNKTVVIVALLFALTMIVKGFPVVVAYLLPYCSKEAENTEQTVAGEEGTKCDLDDKSNAIPLDGIKVDPEVREKERIEEILETEVATDKSDRG